MHEHLFYPLPEIPGAAAFTVILRTNERALLIMTVGIAVIGIYGNQILFSNSLRFGWFCAAVLRTDPKQLFFLLPHGPLEIMSMAAGAAAVQGASFAMIRTLLTGERIQWHPWLRLYIGAISGVAVAALMEVISIWCRWKLR